MPEHLNQETEKSGEKRRGIVRVEPDHGEQSERAKNELPEEKACAAIK
jgi:hypothetical protein